MEPGWTSRQATSLDFERLFQLNDEAFSSLSTAENSRHHRFRQHEELIRHLVDKKRDGHPRILELLDEVIMGGSDARTYIWSASDTLELALALLNLNRTGVMGLNPVLRKVLSGPIDLAEESPMSNAARNAMFEVTMAGLLAGAGISPTLGEATDIVAEFNGRTLLVECKRPFGERAVRSNLKEASKQLSKRQADSRWSSPCSVVAICLSRLFTAGRTIPVVDNQISLHSRFDNWIATNAKTYFNSIEEYRRFGISGVIFYVGSPAVLTTSKKLSFKRACYLRSVGSSRDKELLRDLVNNVLLHITNFEQ